MKIIIVGGGKTGASLTKSLTDEGHDVVVVDVNADRFATKMMLWAFTVTV